MPKPKPVADTIARGNRMFSDVFAVVSCSRCKKAIITHEGHASEFQSRLFRALTDHKRTCLAILKLFPEMAR